MNKLFTTVLPSVMAGALLFGSALSGAQPGTPVPPAPPSAPGAPKPPKAPKAPKVKGHINIDLGDLDEMVDEQIEKALEAIGDNDQIPEHVRESLKRRLEKVRVKVKARINKISPQDLEAMGEELGKMGDEIGAEMDQFGKDMDKWGKDFEKQMKSKQIKFKWKGGHGPDVNVHVDTSDDNDMPGMDMSDMDDMDDMDDAVRDLGDLNLGPSQKSQLKQLRAKSQQEVANAKAELDKASDALAKLLENGSSSEIDISAAIDRVSGLEARIRKARILAWVKARGVLDGSQRDKLERGPRGKSR